jgi:carbon storage regulator
MEVDVLVLSRKANETIKLDDRVEIRVVAISGNRVKLGIEAPDSVHVSRAELLPRISNRDDAGGSAFDRNL